MAKWLTNRALDVDRATSFYDEAMGQELITNTEDSKEGIAELRRATASRVQGLVATSQPGPMRP